MSLSQTSIFLSVLLHSEHSIDIKQFPVNF